MQAPAILPKHLTIASPCRRSLAQRAPAWRSENSMRETRDPNPVPEFALLPSFPDAKPEPVFEPRAMFGATTKGD
jgi:hypothetical protein